MWSNKHYLEYPNYYFTKKQAHIMYACIHIYTFTHAIWKNLSAHRLQCASVVNFYTNNLPIGISVCMYVHVYHAHGYYVTQKCSQITTTTTSCIQSAYVSMHSLMSFVCWRMYFSLFIGSCCRCHCWWWCFLLFCYLSLVWIFLQFLWFNEQQWQQKREKSTHYLHDRLWRL